MPAPDRRPKEPQVYPQLPAAGEPPPQEAAKATYVSFVFPNKRWLTRPWTRLLLADLELDTSHPTLVFTFADLNVRVKFLSRDRKDYLPYWQSFLDGRLTLIEEQPEVCEIKTIAQDVTENFTKPYPQIGTGGGEAAEASDEPPHLDEDGPGHDESFGGGYDEEPGI